MILCANMTNLPGDLNRFEGREDFARFCRQHGLDGVELLPLGGDALGWLPPQAVMGVHLTFQPSWLDFWRGDEAAVAAEFGSLEAAYGVFGGRSPQALPQALRRDLRLAQRIGARYAVCHVSNVTLEECVTYRFTHSDEAVCQGAAEVISQALEGLDLSLDFLVENLWWPGFTLTRPQLTRALLRAIPAPRKGIMLDLGHLMHTCLDLEDQQQALDYLYRCLERHGGPQGDVKGVHLHQSLTGDYVKAMTEKGVGLRGDYGRRAGQVYRHILRIDRHRPFCHPGVGDLIAQLAPRYLTYEFITRDRAQWERFLRRQNRALDRLP